MALLGSARISSDGFAEQSITPCLAAGGSAVALLFSVFP